MKVGLDVGHRNISMVLTKDEKPIDYIEKPILSSKRDGNRAIMDKMLSLIRSAATSRIRGIGLSLPSKIDHEKGVVYDLSNIPYWKGARIKKILEEEFNTKVWMNNDINCFMLGEKYYGICKNLKDIVGITLGPTVGTSIIINNKVYLGDRDSFYNCKCLSMPHYDCVRQYKDSFIRTIEELNFLIKDFKQEIIDTPDHKMWNDLGTLVGRLVTILLRNYNPQAIVLAGDLGKSHVNFSKSMDNYLEKFIHPQTLLNLIIFTPIVEYQQALGATCMIRQQLNTMEKNCIYSY